jgi:chorismate mutase/prephenate dehydrogenase
MRTLFEVRAELDAVDEAILELLAQRAVLVEEAWAIKDQLGLPHYDKTREAALRQRWIEKGQVLGLDAIAVEETAERIIGNSFRVKK